MMTPRISPVGRLLLSALLLVAALVPVGAQTPAPRLGGAQARPSTPPAKPGVTSPGAGPVVVVETAKGTFEFETYPNEAPKTVERILALIAKRFYNGQRVHRVEPGFVVQMGDPTSRDMTKQDWWGRQGSGTPIGVAEISKLRKHVRGAVALAHSGNATRGDSQFFITLTPQPKLDGQFAVFGKVISGMDVVSKLAVTDRIVRVTVRGAS
jgi:peptidyl-prolyl cis-trans isomerase B (cyclophilin B)